MKIANAPTFLTNAERAATQATSTPTCNEEDTAESVAERMAEHRIEQMPVLDADGRLVGMITRQAAETLTSPSTPQ